MVFFTCNKCGDSLKKKDCANHAGKCRPLTLTCVDCHKDFFGDEFVAHTSCVTEAERYGVKGFVSRAPSTAGVAKQEEWTRAVLSASKASGLTFSQKNFLGILTRHGNVPRKKKPFQNFARNVWRDSVHNINVVDQVFEILEAELKKIKGPPKESDTSKTSADIITEINDEAMNSAAEMKIDTTFNKEAKRKKDNATDELIAIANEGEKNTNIEVIKDNGKKRKKKIKEDSCDDVKETKENENKTELAAANSENFSVSKKSKKKKHKKQDAEIEEEVTKNGNGTCEESVIAGDDLINTKNKKKKRRENKALVEGEATKNENGFENESVIAEDDSSSASKKKNKKIKLAEINENGSAELLSLPKKDEKKKDKKKKDMKQDESGAEVPGSLNGQEELQFDAEKDTIKKSKKKKQKQQDVEEDVVPRKKCKSTSG